MTFRYIDCKQCGDRITLQIYTGPIVLSRAAENIKCTICGAEHVYSGDDFGDSREGSSA